MKFLHSGWLMLLLLIPILGMTGVLISRLRKEQWAEFVAPRLRAALVKGSGVLPRWFSWLFLLVACAAIAIAIARPQGEAGVLKEKTMGRNIMVALDISRSMRVDDVKPDRLTQAKVLIYELLESLPNERIGFIGFAGTAHLYAPLTIDHAAVHETVEQIDETWAPLGGSNLSEAVKLATDTLKKTGQENNALIILSDGEKHDSNLNEMIDAAEKSGVYIVAIGVGTEDGGYVPNKDDENRPLLDRSGNLVISRMHPDVMRKLAVDTNGRFAVAGSGQNITALVKSVMEGLDSFEMEGRGRKISIEFYQWLIFPAIVCLMVSIIAGTRWRGIRTAMLLASTLVLTNGAKANEASRAMELLREQKFEDAYDSYHKLADKTRNEETRARYRLGEAIAAYRAKNFRDARSAYSEALLSKDPEVIAQGHMGLGNTLFQQGWLDLTGESYPTDPESIPDINRFDTIVQEALAKMLFQRAGGDGDSSGMAQVEGLIKNWADAIRHYDSSAAASPSNESAKKNRETTLTYLKRLRELLQQHQSDIQQAMQQAQPGEGPPESGENGEGEPGEGEGDEDGDGSGNNRNNRDNGGGEDEEERRNRGKNGDEQDQDGKGDGEESPEERARRLLKENADTEKGPLTRGRREFRDAEKDW